jgi:hypothetical protein
MAYTAGSSGQAFPSWTSIDAPTADQKTPFVFVEPNGQVFHLVGRWSRLSYWRHDANGFDTAAELLPGSPYSLALPQVSASPDGQRIVGGVEWSSEGGWHIDHFRAAQHDGTSWSNGGQGTLVSSAVWEQSGVSADTQGGEHLFFFATAGELSYQYSDGVSVSGPEVIITGVAFDGETDNVATSYTNNNVHVILPVGGTLHHLLIDTATVGPPPDGGPGPDGGGGAAGSGGSGGAGEGQGAGAAGYLPADPARSPYGCGCRAGQHGRPCGVGSLLAALSLLFVSHRARKRRQFA